MAFNITFAAALMQLAKHAGFHGHLVTLSKYNCWFTYEQALAAAAHAGFTPQYQPAAEASLKGENGGIPGSAFFRMLGFAQVTEIEYLGSGESDCVLMDLNRAETPPALLGIADAIFDLGTSEHVFHFPNVLAHMGRVLKPQGVVLHHLPTNNHVNHGFYQFSPTAFFDYYRANGYEPLTCLLNRFNAPHEAAQDFHDIQGSAEWQEFSLDQRAAMTLFLARKLREMPEQVFPLQRIYAEPN